MLSWLGIYAGGFSYVQVRSDQVTQSEEIHCSSRCTAARSEEENWVVTVFDGSHDHEGKIQGSHSTHRKRARDQDVVVKFISHTRAEVIRRRREGLMMSTGRELRFPE